MFSTGYHSPLANAAVISGAGDNNGFESNPNYSYTLNNSFATDLNSGSNTNTSYENSGKDKHDFTNFGITVGTEYSIQGIEVRLDSKVDSTVGSPKMYIQLSWDNGVSWTAAKVTPILSKTRKTYFLGNSADKWGHNWTPDELNDQNFKVRIINVASNTSRDFRLDWISVNVIYTL
jgi:hypothetical protein